MFDKYLRLQIKRVSEEELATSMKQSESAMSAFDFQGYAKPVQVVSEGISVEVLHKSLNSTQGWVERIINGEATFSDITANGALNLEELTIEKEFETLEKYSTTQHPRKDNSEALKKFRTLVELFQYTKHVKNICKVCEQYSLEICLQDPQLQELQALVSNLDSTEERSRITPTEDSNRLEQVKKLLCISDQTPPHCLYIFETVSDSVEFFQFVRDKEFDSAKGAGVFRQQYQLIITQLQHEEHDESVLNHLLAAFKVITPFMNARQSFNELMTKVTSLDTTIGPKQLETVNRNITLIRLWFSRAEVRTVF